MRDVGLGVGRGVLVVTPLPSGYATGKPVAARGVVDSSDLTTLITQKVTAKMPVIPLNPLKDMVRSKCQ